MHPNSRAVVARTHLQSRKRRVTLVAESLADVGADSDRSVAVSHLWQRKMIYSDMIEFPPVKQGQRRSKQLLTGPRVARLLDRTNQG